MSFIPDSLTLIAFCTASIVLAITPGPDMTLMISRSLSDGVKAGLMIVAGTTTGILIHTCLVAFGLSALVVASPTAFWILKIAGAGYLLWLAIQALRGSSSFSVERQTSSDKSLIRFWFNGLGVNLLNPKIIIFFMTFLPQFVRADDPNFTGRLLFLGLLFAVVALPIVIGTVIAADKLSRWLKNNPRFLRWLDYRFASVFSMFAVRILFTQGK
ncbi:MAG: LysE family translocator [Rhizobiaceae bacterium]|nr:LysE family translocator [Rhizobiaceae bacterium]